MKKLVVFSMIMFFSMLSIRSEAKTNVAAGLGGAAFDFPGYWALFFIAPAADAANGKNRNERTISKAADEQVEIAADEEEDGLKVFSIWPAMTSKAAKYVQGFSRIVSDVAYNYNQTYDMDLNPERIFDAN